MVVGKSYYSCKTIELKDCRFRSTFYYLLPGIKEYMVYAAFICLINQIFKLELLHSVIRSGKFYLTLT